MTEKSESKPSDSKPEGSGTERDKPSLNDLLASYGKGTEDVAKAEAKPKSDVNEELENKVRALEDELAARGYREEMDRVIPIVKGDLNVSNKIVEGFIHQKATEDPRLARLWENRKDKPAEFSAALEAIADELAQEVGSSDDQRTVNAIRNSRESKPNAKGFDGIDWASLNDSDFETQKREVYKAAEKGLLR